ncbi:MAG: hypothetical protein PHY43_00170 [Verrucomicrobiales bacterium]|nr:hypothetical protein [Verrucomicrobiales bacterium]
MSKKVSDWHVPADWMALFGIYFGIPIIAIGVSCLLPSLNSLKSRDLADLFYTALGTGCLGSVLLFFARLPLYRQRQFWTFGPRELPSFNRKLYWLAYLFVVASVLLFSIVWLRAK